MMFALAGGDPAPASPLPAQKRMNCFRRDLPVSNAPVGSTGHCSTFAKILAGVSKSSVFRAAD
jgi:hypothetical protein